MVLTRRAARANNSIIRWLPNEVLAAIMADASTADLRALCSTSRLIRNIATPLLYRTVILSTVPQVKCFVRTMKRRAGSSSPLARHVRQFSMTDVGNPDFNIPWSLFKGITSPLFLPNLLSYNGPSSVISSITRDTTSINYACILWHDVDDRIRLGSPATVIGVSTSDRLRDATILAGVATHIPHVEILALRRTGITAAARITYEDTLEIATHLKKFTCLSVLELRDVDRGDDPHDDRGTILFLSSIGLNGRHWKLMLGHWIYYE
ncbi:hypothetical protein B0H14DRAFT_2736364 [Mycena olivaceomarginata]|nr:hypothetical protein B0H14DRAFT_2736364 [Mycena olivaceomarginata]